MKLKELNAVAYVEKLIVVEKVDGEEKTHEVQNRYGNKEKYGDWDVDYVKAVQVVEKPFDDTVQVNAVIVATIYKADQEPQK